MSTPKRLPHSGYQPTTRRSFIKAAGAATVAAPLVPTLLGAQNKSGSKKPVLGRGPHKYEVTHNWGQLPPHIRWGDTHGVCIDEAGLVYIKHRSSGGQPMDAIAVFDGEGKFVRSFGKEYHGGGHGIDVRKEGGEEFLYLSDIHNRRVVKTNLTGEHVWERSFPKETGLYKNVSQYRPTNVAFAPDGGLYVADGYGSHYIHQYDKNARWIRSFGGQGTTPGRLRTPHGLWLDDRPGREPSLVVADRANARLQYFSLEGKHLGFVDQMSFPADVDLAGQELLVPDLHARVTILDKDNKVVVHLGYDAEWTRKVLAGNLRLRKEPKQWEAGRFVHPHDACWDRQGNMFVVEWVPTGRVSFLRRLS